MTTPQLWWQAARPKTLIASLSPVIMGLGFAIRDQAFSPWVAALTVVTAALIQIGTNYANDYFDAKKGADTTSRKGPTRLTQAGLVTPDAMKKAFILCFGLAFILGLSLVWHGGLIILGIGIAAIFFGILYTATPYALAYNGLGDIFVLAFFGPISVAGTYYLQTGQWSLPTALMGLSIGLFSVGILTVNNLRDMNEDRAANKKTLAVRFGKRFSQIEYTACLVIPIALPFWIVQSHPHYMGLCFSCLSVALFPKLITAIRTRTGEALNELLAKTGQVGFVFTILATAGMILI